MTTSTKMPQATTRLIGINTSVFLDSLRLSASIIVLLFHAHDMWMPGKYGVTSYFANIAHAAVIIFFVLSGYVIAYTTTSNNRGRRQYAQARLSRLFSIIAPVLLITGSIEMILWYVSPDLHEMYSRSPSLPRYLFSALFLNEIWFFSAAPPINAPLWSLSYEFWYYIIFGLWFFRSKGWKGLALALLGVAIAGPKIMSMMPIWVFGFVAYRLPKPAMHSTKAWILVGAALLLWGFSVYYLPIFPYVIGKPPFYFANQFVTDWANGFLFAVVLWFLPLSAKITKSEKWVQTFRKIADLTFPIYVLHNPVLVFCRYLLSYERNNTAQLWTAILLTLLLSSFIGILLEKQRPLWNRFFKKILNREFVLSLSGKVAPSS